MFGVLVVEDRTMQTEPPYKNYGPQELDGRGTFNSKTLRKLYALS